MRTRRSHRQASRRKLFCQLGWSEPGSPRHGQADSTGQFQEFAIQDQHVVPWLRIVLLLFQMLRSFSFSLQLMPQNNGCQTAHSQHKQPIKPPGRCSNTISVFIMLSSKTVASAVIIRLRLYCAGAIHVPGSHFGPCLRPIAAGVGYVLPLCGPGAQIVRARPTHPRWSGPAPHQTHRTVH